MIPIQQIKKSPLALLGGSGEGGSGQKTGLLKYIIPASRGTTSFYGPFSFGIIARQEGFINE